jgi:hypothetical protein
VSDISGRILTSVLCTLIFMSAFGAETKNGFSMQDMLVPAREIREGGPERDGIPALFSPRFVAATDADSLDAQDRVLGITHAGVSKAYPIRILNYHEIVNDRFKDTPVAVTFCPLCASGIAFFAEIGGQARHFGVSGLLYNSDVLMYDRETDSLWSQVMGQAISGPAKGLQLKTLPARHTTWRDWRARHPGTLVLVPPPLSRHNYNVDPYAGYADSNKIWFPVSHTDRRYKNKAVVVGAKVGEATKAWPFEALPADLSRITDTLGGRTIVVEYDLASQAGRVLDTDGRELPSFTAYWFAWIAFHPDTEVYAKP